MSTRRTGARQTRDTTRRRKVSPLTIGASPAGATTVTVNDLLLWDHDGGIALASLTSQAEDNTVET